MVQTSQRDVVFNYLRARSEQVIADANAMIGTRDAPLDLEDGYGTGHLSFVLRHGDRSARISLGQTAGRAGWSCSGPTRTTYGPSNRRIPTCSRTSSSSC
jgi:hypothetical protein